MDLPSSICGVLRKKGIGPYGLKEISGGLSNFSRIEPDIPAWISFVRGGAFGTNFLTLKLEPSPA